jgi:hypothetical protein
MALSPQTPHLAIDLLCDLVSNPPGLPFVPIRTWRAGRSREEALCQNDQIAGRRPAVPLHLEGRRDGGQGDRADRFSLTLGKNDSGPRATGRLSMSPKADFGGATAAPGLVLAPRRGTGTPGAISGKRSRPTRRGLISIRISGQRGLRSGRLGRGDAQIHDERFEGGLQR